MTQFLTVWNVLSTYKNKRFEVYNSQSSGAKIQVAIGLSAGVPVTDRDALFGETIQLAQRACYIADGGQIVAASTVKDHYIQKSLGISSDEGEVQTLNPMQEKFLNRLMDIMERVWNEEAFHVDDFSKLMGLSRSQLYRKITSLTGRSPNEFVREFRLRKAIELIERQQDNISQIAFEAGFSSPSYFSKCFQKRFGVLPSDYASAID
ncbi:MAG: helix-turn-helix domain-containing protein [Phycisphaerae bacterium]|nr:helix-turn-helix domain-containing protein [Phycisphaerae bacterium]